MIIAVITAYMAVNIFAVAMCKAAGKAEPKRCTGNEK